MDGSTRVTYAGAIGIGHAAMDIALIELGTIEEFYKEDTPSHVMNVITRTMDGLRDRISRLDNELVGTPLER